MQILYGNNTIKHGIIGSSAGDKAVEKLLHSLEASIQLFDYALPRGWRLIVEVDYPGYPEEQLCLDLQADQGGGSFAEAKMATIKHYPELSTSGMLKLETVKALVNEHVTGLILDKGEPEPNTYPVTNEQDSVREAAAMRQLINQASSSSGFTRPIHDWIRDNLGITVFNGGIRCKLSKEMTVIDSDDSTHLPTGEIRVAFSGAKEHEDIVISIIAAIIVTSAFEDEIKPLTGNDFPIDDPSVKFLLDWRLLKFADTQTADDDSDNA